MGEPLKRFGARVALVAGALALATTGACAPSSFDGLVGGTKSDASLAAPRPVSPVSVSTVATSRPRLAWALAEGETGAIVEMSRTRAFDPATTKTFTAEGHELVVPEDLEPGIWFWRLRGVADAKTGTTASAIWEVLVRGPAALAASDAPTGSVVDYDGDGYADLVAVADDSYGPFLVVFLGTADGFEDQPLEIGYDVYGPPSDAARARATGGVTHGPSKGSSLFDATSKPAARPVALTGGLDVDGDGLSDILHVGLDRTGGAPFDHVVVERGTANLDVLPDYGSFPLAAASASVPRLGTAGDVNADGFGDLLLADDHGGYAALGGADDSTGALLPLYGAEAQGPAGPVLGAFDANDDGVSDVAVALAPPDAPMLTLAGARERVLEPRAFEAPAAARAAAASALASGDFDGDGLADVAGTVRAPGGRATVCLWLANPSAFLAAAPCSSGVSGDAAFGASLAAADLDGDGKDELLTSATVMGEPAVRVARLDGDALDVAPLIEGCGSQLTTIWPGRPGKARWAATCGDSSAIAVFEGEAELTTLVAPPDVYGLGRALR